MTDPNDNLPACFGKLAIVFPIGEDGLRHTPESCMTCCCYKTECLERAMKGKEGLSVQEEVVDRAYASGMLNFMERWSQKKLLRRKINKKRPEIKE